MRYVTTVLAALLGILSGCGVGANKRVLTRPGDYNDMVTFPASGDPVDIKALEEEYPELRGLVMTAPEYIEEYDRIKKERSAEGKSVFIFRLAPGARISITVEGEKELSGTITVPPTGDWYFPFIGRLRMQGLTLEEFQTTFEKKLEKILRKPRVRVNLLSVRKSFATPAGIQYVESAGVGSIKVLGVVSGAQFLNSVEFSGGETLVSVLSRAGLPGDSDWRQIRVIRRDPIDPLRKSRVIICDMWNFIALADVRQDIPLFPGDVIFVPGKLTLGQQFDKDWQLTKRYINDAFFLDNLRDAFRKNGAFRNP